MDLAVSRNISYRLQDALMDAYSRGLLVSHEFSDGRSFSSWPDAETILMSVNATQDTERLTEFVRKFQGSTYTYNETPGLSLRQAKFSYPHRIPRHDIPPPHPSMDDDTLLEYLWPVGNLVGAYSTVLWIDIGAGDSNYTELEEGEFEGVEISDEKWVRLFNWPVAVGSNRCNMAVIRSYLDDEEWSERARYILEDLTHCEITIPDGYLIVKGRMKKVNIVDRLQMNIPYTMKIEDTAIVGNAISEIRSLDRDNGVIATHNIYLKAEKDLSLPKGVDSVLYKFYRSMLVLVVNTRDKDKVPINIYDAIAGMGAYMTDMEPEESCTEFTNMVSSFVNNDTEIMRALSITYRSRLIKTKKDAIDYADRYIIPPKSDKGVHQLILPHCGTFISKVMFLSIMVVDVMFVLLGRTDFTDMKDFIFKRWDTFGHRGRDYIRSMLQRNNNISKINSNMDNLISIMGQNKWPSSYKAYRRKGNAKEEDLATAIVNDALTYNNSAIIDSIRGVKIGASSTGNTAATRRVHTSQYNLQCPANTPENENIGLNNSLSEVVLISEDLTSEERDDLLRLIYSEKYQNGNILLILDGQPLFFTSMSLYNDLWEAKDNGSINPGISITVRDMWEGMSLRCIVVGIAHGRPLQPVLRLPESMSMNDFEMLGEMSWEELVENRRVTLLDAYEVSFNCVISEWLHTAIDRVEDDIVYFNTDYTHSHIIPGGMLSQATNCLSYLEHNPAARGTYATLHIKQSIAHPFLYPEDRFDHESNAIMKPEAPLVSTRTGRRLGMTDHQSPYIPYSSRKRAGYGTNANVAFISNFGNYDDAVHISQALIDRQALTGFHYDIFVSDENISVSAGVNNSYNVVVRQMKTISGEMQYKEIRSDDGVGLIDPDYSDSVITPYAHPTIVEVDELPEGLDLSDIDRRLRGMNLYEVNDGLLYARFGYRYPIAFTYLDRTTGETFDREYTDLSIATEIPGFNKVGGGRIVKDKLVYNMALVAISEDLIDNYDRTFISNDTFEWRDTNWYVSRSNVPVPRSTPDSPNKGRTVAVMKRRVIKRGDTAIILVERNKDTIVGLRKEKFSATFGTIEEIQRGTITRIRVAMPIGPEPGNKYAFLHAQKNVCAKIIPLDQTPRARWHNPVTGEDEEMMIEVIFNPLGIPSRMTMGLIYEAYFTGTLAYIRDIGLYDLYRENREEFDGEMYDRYGLENTSELLDEISDSTPFVYDNIDKKERCRQLREAMGIPDEAMYDIFYEDGCRLEGKVFCGTAYYVKLRHLVDNKRRARGYVGKRDPLTGQPVKGRRKEGGANTGTMESDVYKAHGARAMQWERMNKVSDGRIVYKCSQCGGLVSRTGTKEQGYTYKCIDHDGTLLPELVYEVSTVQSWELFRYYQRALGLEITEHFKPA